MMLSKQCPDGQPRSPGVPTQRPQVCVMTFQAFEQAADRFAPLALLVIGMLTAFATAGLGIA